MPTVDVSYCDLPNGYTIFCDDIRQEVAGKESYIGVYASYLFAQRFPVILGRFGLSITYREPAGADLVPVNIRVTFLPDDNGDEAELFNADVDMAEAKDLLPEAEDGGYYAWVASALLSPLVIAGPGKIKVRAYRGERREEIRLGSLKVRLGSKDIFPSPVETTASHAEAGPTE